MSRAKLLTSRPAPTSRTSESPTSAITSAERVRPWFAVLPRSPSLRNSLGFDRDDCKAGIRPKITPQRMEARKLKANTSRLIPICVNSRISGGLNANNDGTVTIASKRPSTPPNSASRTLSVSNWRSKRRRLAPSVVRIEISLARAVARARRRFATFAQPIRSTTTTAASKTSRTGRISPTTYSCRGRNVIPVFSFASGYCVSRRRPMVSSSARACCAVTPRFNRAQTSI